MSEEFAIDIDGVSKSYRSGQISGLTFMQQIESGLARFRGIEDPNSKIADKDNVTLNGTHKNQRFWALKNVSFRVQKGEVVSVLGRNGAGKSTLLQIISRITEADSGVVRIRGKIASMLGAGVGFSSEMTGRENVYLNGSILGMTPSEIDENMDSIAEFAEIREFLDTPVKRYSSGMRSRLGFSVAVHLDAEIMILDEVLATGDKVFRRKCVERMKELSNSGRTILIVTHMPQLLKNICERGVVLRNGVKCFDGDVQEAIDVYMK